MTPVCPFAKAGRPEEPSAAARKQESPKPSEMGKCPLGFDSHNFKIGPLSCTICHALLFQTTKCLPCSHLFCKPCISRFKDCPLCGADIETTEPDNSLQSVVDRFIEGHARIRRSQADADASRPAISDNTNNKVIYEDVSLERGAFLVQQAMRAFRANNIESAKSRLQLCAQDIRDQVDAAGSTPELCSQLGAVLGMLGDCCRAVGDANEAVKYFEESVEFLTKLPANDLEITHTLSVSMNKIGDLKYYDGDLQAARSYYSRSLDVRRSAIEHHPTSASQVLDVAVSLAKVADVDRSLGNEELAIKEFEEAIKLLEPMKLKSEEAGLEQRRMSVLEFLRSQVGEKQSAQDK